MESTKRAHFGNFALISHTRFAVWCKSHTTGHISAETHELFDYLSQVLNQFQKYRRRSRGQAKNKRRVATSGIFIHTRARVLAAWDARKSEFGCVVTVEILRFRFPSFLLSESRSSFPSRFLCLSLSFFHGHAEQAMDYPDLHAGYPQCKRI